MTTRLAYTVPLRLLGDMAALLDVEGADGAILVGHSLGGYLSLSFHIADPEARRGARADRHMKMNSVRGSADRVPQSPPGCIPLWGVFSGALSALLLLFTAVLFSAGLRPIVDRMAKRMPFGVAAGIAFSAVIVVTVAIGFVLIQPVGAELVKFVQAVPGYAVGLRPTCRSATLR